MTDETLFYILGSALAVSAVVASFVGLRFKGFPGRAMPLVVIWFVVLIGAATTYAVQGSKEEQKHRAAELAEANEEAEHEAEEVPKAGGGEEEAEPEGAPAGGAEPEGGAEGSGETLQLAASPTAIAFDTTSLTAAKPGEVTIDFENPSAIPHDVVIKQGSKEIAATEQISESETSVSADLSPGSYTFYCSVPGHAQAGMEGTLTVK